MRPFKVGVVGIGDISGVYIDNLKQYRVVEVVACAGRDLKKARGIINLADMKNLCVGCAPDTFLGSRLQTCREIVDSGTIGEVTAARLFPLRLTPTSPALSSLRTAQLRPSSRVSTSGIPNFPALRSTAPREPSASRMLILSRARVFSAARYF